MIWTGPWKGFGRKQEQEWKSQEGDQLDAGYNSRRPYFSDGYSGASRVIVAALKKSLLHAEQHSSYLGRWWRGRHFSTTTYHGKSSSDNVHENGDWGSDDNDEKSPEPAVLRLLLEAVHHRNAFTVSCAQQVEEWAQAMQVIQDHKQALELRWMQLEETRTKCAGVASLHPAQRQDVEAWVRACDGHMTAELTALAASWTVLEEKLVRQREASLRIEFTNTCMLQANIDRLYNAARDAQVNMTVEDSHRSTLDRSTSTNGESTGEDTNPCTHTRSITASEDGMVRSKSWSELSQSVVSEPGVREKLPTIKEVADFEAGLSSTRMVVNGHVLRNRLVVDVQLVTLCLAKTRQWVMSRTPAPNGIGRVTIMPKRAKTNQYDSSHLDSAEHEQCGQYEQAEIEWYYFCNFAHQHFVFGMTNHK
jgi:hypothetical protein